MGLSKLNISNVINNFQPSGTFTRFSGPHLHFGILAWTLWRHGLPAVHFISRRIGHLFRFKTLSLKCWTVIIFCGKLTPPPLLPSIEFVREGFMELKKNRYTFFTFINFNCQSCPTLLSFFCLQLGWWTFSCRSAIDVSSVTSGRHRKWDKFGRKTHPLIATRSHLVNLLLLS